MRVFWSDKRANGQPLQAGTVCLVTDLEDGTNPIYTYGKDQAEIIDKLAMQNANAQLALLRRQTPPATAPEPRKITGDDVMQATADMANPAKAPAAIATLYEAATGIDPVQAAQRAYAMLAMEWEAQTSDFYPHPGNRQLVGDKAIRMAGMKPGLVTRDILDAAFTQLRAQGLLFERPDQPDGDPPTSNPPNLPVESQVQSIERPRGTRYATAARSSTFTAPQTVSTRTLKYTEEQIRNMPDRERMKVIDDPDYIKACEYYYSGARA